MTDEPLPRRFGDYVLLEHIGRGGMGDVWLAKQDGYAGIDKCCVIKAIHTQRSDADGRARFIDEARTVVALTHRNICHVFDVGAVGGDLFVAMELVDGCDLRTLTHRGRLPEPVALTLVGELLDALDYAHRRTDATGAPLDLVHRDVSSENLMVTFEGELKLIDFGLAASTLKRQRTAPGIVMGKLQYMSPEQARGDAIDGRTDQFAAAVVAYELVSGARFYEGLDTNDIWRVLIGPDYEPTQLRTMTPSIAAILSRALLHDPAARFASCADMRAALLAAQLAERQIAGLADVRTAVSALMPGAADAARRRRAELLAQPMPPPAPPESPVAAPAPTEPAHADVAATPPAVVVDSAAHVAPPRRSLLLVVAVVVVVVALLALVAVGMHLATSTPDPQAATTR